MRRQVLAGSVVLFDVIFRRESWADGTVHQQVMIQNQTDAPAFQVSVAFWAPGTDAVRPWEKTFLTASLISLAPRQVGTLDADTPALLEPGPFLVRVHGTSALGVQTRMDLEWSFESIPDVALERVEIDLGGEHHPIVWPTAAREPKIQDPWRPMKPVAPGNWSLTT